MSSAGPGARRAGHGGTVAARKRQLGGLQPGSVLLGGKAGMHFHRKADRAGTGRGAGL
jgi:hypothetical protein